MIFFPISLFLQKEFGINIFDKEFFIILTIFLISGFVALMGRGELTSIDILEHSQENLKYGNYWFRISAIPEEKFVIRGFRIFLDYSKNKNIGNITFYSYEDELNPLKNLRIYVPSEYNITNVTLTTSFDKLKENENYTVYFSGNVIKIEEFNINTTEKIIFLVLFDAVNFTSPRGTFSIEVDSRRIHSFDENVYFYLGNYYCKYSPCFNNLHNSNMITEHNIMKIGYNESYYENVETYRLFRQKFSINTVDRDIEKSIEFKLALGTGLIVSALVMFIEGLRRIITHSVSLSPQNYYVKKKVKRTRKKKTIKKRTRSKSKRKVKKK